MSCSLSKHIRGLFVICFYSGQCILTEKFFTISSSLLIVTIILITRHTVQFWAVWHSEPSVIMAAADLCNKLEFIILYTQARETSFSELRYLATNSTRPADKAVVRGQRFYTHRQSLAIALFAIIWPFEMYQYLSGYFEMHFHMQTCKCLDATIWVQHGFHC